MESSKYSKLRDEIYTHIVERFERVDEEGKRFATRGTAKEVLHHKILLRFFRSLDLKTAYASSEDDLNLNEEHLIARLHERELHDFLAILAFGSCCIEAARIFTTKLLAKKTWPKTLCTLPANRDSLNALFGEEVTPDKFLTVQACFCPIVIVKGKAVPVQNLERQRLPYLEERKRGSGAFGTVYEVKIAKGHVYDPQLKAANQEPLALARKDYVINAEPRNGLKTEPDHEIMKKILSSDRKCPNIVEAFCGLAVGPSKYSLFMPLAICDLKDYMMELHPSKPNSMKEKADMILCLCGLARGLNFLHKELKTADGEDLVCYHMDLKPGNILVFHEEQDGPTRYIWKISDFGMSRVKTRHRDQAITREKDFNSLFTRRRKSQNEGFSATINRRGEGEFLPPESIAATPTMNEKSDVWSLGCVASVVFAYLEGGKRGVNRYQDERMNHPKADGYDRFFLRNRGFAFSKTHPVVRRWHAGLIKRASQRNRDEGEAVELILDFLEDSVLQDQSKRCEVNELGAKLHQTYRAYKQLESTMPYYLSRDSSPYRGVVDKIASQSHLRNSRGHRKETTSGCQAEKWFVNPVDAFKGCEISASGSIAVFWTDKKLYLFTSQSLSATKTDTVEPAAQYTLPERGCIWKSVSLTDRVLVASTSGGKFKCYIFQLQRGRLVDATLNHGYPVPLDHPEITRLALSPKGQTMACVLGDRDTGHNAGWLFLSPVSSPEDCWLDGLEYPAADVIQLSFPTEEEIYMVLRPNISARGREYGIRIIHLSLQAKRLNTLVIESRGLDSSRAVNLFTSFAPLHENPNVCAVVTRERRLHMKSLTDIENKSTIEKDIKNYHILKVMMSRDDERIIALGRHSADHTILLLEIMVPRVPTKDIELRELVELPGLSYNDEICERLCDEGDDKFVLLAALMGANQRAIYRIRISGLGDSRTSFMSPSYPSQDS